MRAILLVDDEPGHLIGISKLLRRFRPEYEIRTAKNGLEALKLCETQHYSIIITDIQMPIMDGLHFIEQLPKGSEPRRTIYLTGYNYFEYAQKAIGLGTFEYVLKPIDVDKFMAVLEKAELSLQEEQNGLVERANLAAKLQAVVPVYQTRILTDWLLGKPLSSEACKELEASIRVPEAGCLIVLELQDPMGRMDWEIDMLQIRIRDWLIDELGRTGECICVIAPDHDRQLVVVLKEKLPEEQELAVWCDSVHNQHARLHCKIGVSDKASRILSEAPRLFHEALLACELGFYYEEQRIFHARACRLIEGQLVAIDSRDELLLMEALHREAMTEELAEAVHTVIHRQLGTDIYLRPSDLTEMMKRLISRLADAAEFLSSETKAQQIAAIMSAQKPASLNGLKQAAAGWLANLADAITEQRKGQKENVIQDCLAYIDKHYMDDLSLESVAAVFHFNPSYFSQYFKSKLNINFSQYLTQVRLAKAKALLERSDERVYQVAERLGYHDVKYFNRVFKKEFGLTPEEYRSIARRMKQA